jgi:glycosyltransferase involved in cell wall biosynthesis
MVTPVLNSARFIRRTIESVLEQQGDFELEYIICDGGSTDKTVEIIREYQDRCRLIQRPDSGPADAINFGMDKAAGEICGWLGADDLLLPGALNLVVKTFSENPQHEWLYGRCRIIDENETEIRRGITFYKNLLGCCFSRQVLWTENFISQPATFWRADLWRRCGGLDTAYKAAFDYDLWLRFAAQSAPLSLPVYLASFRRHSASISELNFTVQFSEELAISQREASSLCYQIHRFNYYKIVAIYSFIEIMKKCKNNFSGQKS